MDYNHNNNANQRITKHTVKFSARLTARIRLSETNHCLPRPLSSSSSNVNSANPNQSQFPADIGVEKTNYYIKHKFHQYVPPLVIEEQAVEDGIREKERTSTLLKNIGFDSEQNPVATQVLATGTDKKTTTSTSSSHEFSTTSHLRILNLVNSLPPFDIHHPPLFIDPLARYFGGSGAVSSLYDHTHFLYRKILDNWRTNKNIFRSHRGQSPKKLSKDAIDKTSSIKYKQSTLLVLLMHLFEGRRLSYHRQAMPYIQVRTRLYDDVITQWCEDTRNCLDSSSIDTNELVNTSSIVSSEPIIQNNITSPALSTSPTTLIHQTSSQIPAPLLKPMQLVLIGAGFDSRVYRLPTLHDVDVFEIDQEDVMRYKQSILDIDNKFSTSNAQTAPTTLSPLSSSSSNAPIKPLQSAAQPCRCSICLQQKHLASLPFYKLPNTVQNEEQPTHMPITWPPKLCARTITRLVGDVGKKKGSMQGFLGFSPHHSNSIDFALKQMSLEPTSSTLSPSSPIPSLNFDPTISARSSSSHFSYQITYTTPITFVISKSNQNRTNVYAKNVTTIPLLPSDTLIDLIYQLLNYILSLNHPTEFFFHIINDLELLCIYFQNAPLSIPIPHFILSTYNSSVVSSISSQKNLALFHISYLVAIQIHHQCVLTIQLQQTTTPTIQLLKNLAATIQSLFISPSTLPQIEFLQFVSQQLTQYTTMLHSIFLQTFQHIVDSVSTFQRINWITGLIQTGFQPASPTIIAIEGVLMYLQMVQVKETLQLCHDLCTFHKDSAVISDIYTSYAYLNQDSYYSLFRAGASIHDKEWLFNHKYAPELHHTDKISHNVNNFSSTQHVSTENNRAFLEQLEHRRPHDFIKPTKSPSVTMGFKSGAFSTEETLMQLLDQCCFTQAKIGIFKNQSYLDYRLEPLLLPTHINNTPIKPEIDQSVANVSNAFNTIANETTHQHMSAEMSNHSIQEDSQLTNETTHQLSTEMNNHPIQQDLQFSLVKNSPSCLNGLIPLTIEDVNHNITVFSPHVANPEISQLQLPSHPFSSLISPSLSDTPVIASKLATDTINIPKNYPAIDSHSTIPTYRFNNSICSFPIDNIHSRSTSHTVLPFQQEIQSQDDDQSTFPLCLQNYIDSHLFLNSPLFSISNYVACKYPFPHHTYISQIDTVLKQLPGRASNMLTPLQQLPTISSKNGSITTCTTHAESQFPFCSSNSIRISPNHNNENGIEPCADLATNSQILHQTITNQRPYSDPDSIRDQFTFLPQSTNTTPISPRISISTHNDNLRTCNTPLKTSSILPPLSSINQPFVASTVQEAHNVNSDHLSEYLHAYPPVFGITYNAFGTNSQHECEPGLRWHNSSCLLFHKFQKIAQKTVYNPFFLFQLYDIPFCPTKHTSLNPIDSALSASEKLLQKIDHNLIDINLDHNIQYYNSDTYQTVSSQMSSFQQEDKLQKIDHVGNKSDLVSSSQPPFSPKPQNKHTKQKKQCSCQPCPDMVEYYVFVSKP